MVTHAKVYQSYYTKSASIVRYMVEKLSIAHGLRTLEPCAGDGVFLDALNNKIPSLPIDVYEMEPQAATALKNRYESFANIHIHCEDTLTSPGLSLLSNAGGFYDRIIGNPPYGAWIDYEKRRYLRKLYPGLYVKETYALFLYRCVQLLRESGVLVFILPDTFLNIHRHAALRKYLLRNTLIREVCLFPSSFFPGVNFGYSNLCVITLQKSGDEDKCTSNHFRVITGLKSVDEMWSLARSLMPYHEVFTFRQDELLQHTDYALYVGDPAISQLIEGSDLQISDIADCVTGFYSGNDKKYLRAASAQLRNAKKYAPLDKEFVCDAPLTSEQKISGIEGSQHFIPIVKGGGIKYLKPDHWYMDWSVEVVGHYKRDKKARFQNPQYYFRHGIGVPMVSSTRVTAALIEEKLFDQSIVGIFPKDEKWIYYLLAFFNSSTCNTLIRTINPSANNPANYIKKLPFVEPMEEVLREIDKIISEILLRLRERKDCPAHYESTLDRLIKDVYGA